VHRQRVRLLQALVRGVPCLTGSPQFGALLQEFGEVHSVRRIRRATRRRILEVLHSTRALDSTLKAFVDHHGCLSKGRHGRAGSIPKNLGAYLYALRDHTVPALAKLPEAQRQRFQKTIVDARNTYMHQAGAFPGSDVDIHLLLGEMHACLAVVSRL